VKIKRWALLTVLLYLLTIFLLSGPVLFVGLWDFGTSLSWSDVEEFYREVFKTWEYWAALAFVGVLQFVVLLTPMQIARQRPVSRARWIWLALTASLMIGLLVAALGTALVETLFFDKGDIELFAVVGMVGVFAWIAWFLIFFSYTQIADDSSKFVRVIDRLIAGSVAELLIAVPCHVYVREQKYCCAGFGTFAGIATGLSVLLFAFGPGVFFLFVKRVRRLQRIEGDVPKLLPDLRAGVAALNAETKDAGIWALAATALLLVPGVLFIVLPDAPTEFLVMSRIAFVVMGCMSLYHGVRGYCDMERRQRWMLFAGAALVEAVALVAWRGFV
jgi:hypothetical protein